MPAFLGVHGGKTQQPTPRFYLGTDPPGYTMSVLLFTQSDKTLKFTQTSEKGCKTPVRVGPQGEVPRASSEGPNLGGERHVTTMSTCCSSPGPKGDP